MSDSDVLHEQPQSFLRALSQHISHEPERPAVCYVEPRGSFFDYQGLTFAELARRTRCIAKALDRHGLQAGDRILLSAADPRTVLCCVVGAMGRGIATVPLQTADQFRSRALFHERVTTIASDCTPSLVVAEDLAQWNRAMGHHRLPIETVASATLEHESCSDVEPASDLSHLANRPADECAFIQYTSGSTRRPRGVIVTHHNLWANVRAMGLASGISSSDRMFAWLPLHHDMGLTGSLLYPLYWRAQTFLMSPMTFFRRPASWLRGIDEVRATLTVGPTFAYNVCATKLPDRLLRGIDLSSCRTAYCGAEPIHAEVVDRFTERFRSYGLHETCIYPVYGLAEATLAASFPEPGTKRRVDRVTRHGLYTESYARPAAPEETDVISAVSVGRSLPDHEIEVVDPITGAQRPERRLGEIWLRGPSISPAYYGETDRPRRELRTKDLGYMAEGQLYVVDRMSDMIRIGQRQLAPSDIEREATRVRGVRAGRAVAFGLHDDEDDLDVLHLVAEMSPRSWRPQRAVAAELVDRVRRRYGIGAITASLVPPGSVPRTSSGKLRRGQCRENFIQGAYPPTFTLRQRAALKWRHILQQVAFARSLF